MSSTLLDFRNHNKDHPDFKYSEMMTMDESQKYRNGSIDDPNQDSIDCERSDSVCPLTATVLQPRRRSEAKMDYQSDEHLDYRVSRIKARRYRKIAIIMAGIVSVLTIVVIVLAVVLANETSGSEAMKNPQRSKVCTKPECIGAAARILGSMNRSVNPCDDFYTYSCGKWERDHVIPEDKSMISAFNKVRDDVALVLKRVLEAESSADRPAIKKAKTYYRSCTDTAKVDALGGQPVLDIIADLGGMPLFGDPLSSFSLEEALGHSNSKYGVGSLVSMGVGPDFMNSSANIIQIDQPHLGMPSRDFYIVEVRRNASLPGYKTFMHDYLEMLWKEGGTKPYNDAALQDFIDQVIELETKLAEAMMASEDRRDSFSIYRKRTISAMTSDHTPDFDWGKFINTVFDLIDEKIDSSRDIVSLGDHYFTNFTAILSKYNSEFLQNYIVWRNVQARNSFLGKSYRDTQVPFRLATTGTSQEKARWRTCTEHANRNFLMPVGSLFVQEVFPEVYKDVTEGMVEDIRTSFIDALPANDWMDQSTKLKAEKKADMVTPVIAYPDYINDAEDPKLDNEFEAVEVDAGKYFQNGLNLELASSREQMLRLDEPVDRDEWLTGPAVVNAFYASTRNQISFPAAILQPPFYDPGQPSSMNYGGIGMVIGHEITHGFDDSGSQYNGIGDLDNWWTNTSKKNFEGKAKCIVEQYGNFYWEDSQSKLNGKLTLGENIADNGGIRQAYNAYKTWKSTNEEDFSLPGLEDFSQDQLFFLSNAQVWCGLYRPELAARLTATDPHSPGIFRVIGPLSNFEKFGEAYNCNRGQDRMYPKGEDICRVW